MSDEKGLAGKAKTLVDSLNSYIIDKVDDSLDKRLENAEDEYKDNREALEKKREEDLARIDGNIEKVRHEVFRSYLPAIQDCYKVKADDNNGEAKSEYSGVYTPDKIKQISNRLKLIQISKLVVEKEEKIIDKLKNVYNVLTQAKCNVALIFEHLVSGCNAYIAVCNTDENGDPADAEKYMECVKGSLFGNFPGIEINKAVGINVNGNKLDGLVGKITAENITAVSIVSNIASDKSEEFIAQSVEKLLHGFTPIGEKEEYILVLLAEPQMSSDIAVLKNRCYDLYNALSPFAEWQESISIADTSNLTAAISAGVNLGANFNHSVNAQAGVPGVASVSAGVSVGLSAGINASKNKAKSRGQTETESFTQTRKMYHVKDTLDRIEEQNRRYTESEALGLWKFSAYVLAKSYSVSVNAANMYRSLTQGEKSYIQNTAINTWGSNKKSDVDAIKKSLGMLTHPKFELKEEDEDSRFSKNVDACSYITGVEIAKALSLPKRSVKGFTVVTCAEFGREVVPLSADGELNLEIGCIYHMHSEETKNKVKLNSKSLTAHTFVTGSTGSGKSNTVYKLITETCLKEDSTTKFLIIEPAKGEYKDVFGGYLDKKKKSDVFVWGTNPSKMPLLRMNPFSFPIDEIHVLEHIDRLVEVFNACWPMYAAMPAILKAAIEDSYRRVGWSLRDSICNSGVFPTFNTLIDEIPRVIQKAEYSANTSSDYKGALITRVESLTKGIHGQIFCGKSIPDEMLFDQNVIIDLSRVGSVETKALLMGVLVLKLQEYRIACRIGSNAELRHITVLEEAHNLLRRTSDEQSQESSNLQGKSVEMLANAIAEMRTYGEGFIIADQSPGLLDMSVIRNTNTKIIMRLPDEGDRQLVGRAAGLNDEQIQELSRLRVGVAAISQQNWLEPVLCKVDEFADSERKAFDNSPVPEDSTAVHKFLSIAMGVPDCGELTKEEVDSIYRWRDAIDIGDYVDKMDRMILKVVRSEDLNPKQRGEMAYNLFDGKRLAGYLMREPDLSEISMRIREKYGLYDNELTMVIQNYLLNTIHQSLCDGEIKTKLESILPNAAIK